MFLSPSVRQQEVSADAEPPRDAASGSRWQIVLLCMAGIVLNSWIACSIFLPHAWAGRNDFLGFYTGATLAGDPNLYDRGSTADIHVKAVGETGEIQFGRFPYYAWLLRPLALLPYRTAYLVWEILSASALVAFVVLWPSAPHRTRWCVAFWMLPVFICFFNGQEDLFLLCWLGLAAWLLRKQKPLIAGMVLTLCASKFHLFTLVPLVVVAQRRWRMATGMLAGAGVLAAVSFAVAGPNWPAAYYAVLTHPGINTSLEHMPNLHSLFGTGWLGVMLQIVTTAALAFGVYVAAKSTASFERALALALAASILTAFHGYIHDGSLLLPAILAFLGAAEARIRLLVFALASPLPWFLLQFRWPLPVLTQLLILAFVCAGIWLLLKEVSAKPGFPGFERTPLVETA
jgi:Glycosyltransferase family 87